jgi:hypothetical protein
MTNSLRVVGGSCNVPKFGCEVGEVAEYEAISDPNHKRIPSFASTADAWLGQVNVIGRCADVYA